MKGMWWAWNRSKAGIHTPYSENMPARGYFEDLIINGRIILTP
jgi:hypothetical protein